MNPFEGRYYDGRSSRSLPVEVSVHRDGTVRIEGDGLALRYRVEDLSLSPRLGHAPRRLSLPGGAICELPDRDALDRELGQSVGASRWVSALERRRPVVVLAVGFTALFAWVTIAFGIPALARVVAMSLPVAVDEKLGEGSLAALDEALFAESELDEGARARLGALFESIASERTIEAEPRLVFRDGGAVGANAFALPSGIVILTDQIVELAESDDELASVIAHELGHVAHRHALRSVLQDSGVVLIVSAALGDVASISTLAAALPTLLIELEYSRRFEREADAYALSLLDEMGIPPEAFARMLERLEEKSGASALPSYLSSHPATAERARGVSGE